MSCAQWVGVAGSHDEGRGPSLFAHFGEVPGVGMPVTWGNVGITQVRVIPNRAGGRHSVLAAVGGRCAAKLALPFTSHPR